MNSLQPTEAGSGQGHWLTFDVTDGMSGATVFATVEGPDGRLWFGTQTGGVSIYDGAGFEKLGVVDGLPDAEVRALVVGKDDHLWIGTKGGVALWDGTRVSVPEWLRPALGHFVRCVLLVGDEVWPGTEAGLMLCGTSGSTLVGVEQGLPDREVHSLLRDSDGTTWVGTDAGLGRFSKHPSSGITIESSVGDVSVRSLMRDSAGRLVVGTFGSGLHVLGDKHRVFRTEDGLASDQILCTVEDSEGSMWIGTWGSGLSRFRDGAFQTLTTADGLAQNDVWSAYQDREGQLWFGTWGSGVSRYGGPVFRTFSTPQGLASSDVWCTAEDRDGLLWFGTWGGGLFAFDGAGFVRYSTEDGLPSLDVVCLLVDRDGILWVGTVGGLACFDGETFKTFKVDDGLVDDEVVALAEDRDGGLWIGTGLGACRYDGSSFETLTSPDGPGDKETSGVLADSSGRVWFATDFGVSCLKEGSFRTYTTANGLGSNTAYALAEDESGTIWLTTSGGLGCLEDDRFRNVTAEQGLAHTAAYGVMSGPGGKLWVTTLGGGVSVFDGDTFQTLTRDDGLASNVVMDILTDRSGNTWFCTPRGVTRFLQPAESAPRVRIEALVADRRYESPSSAVIPHSIELIAFEVGGVSLKTRPGALVYRYRLSGHDDEWHSTRSRRIEFSGVSEGAYRFEVLAVDRDLCYSPEPAVLEIEVSRDQRDVRIDELERRVAERTEQLELAHRDLEASQQALINELERELNTAREMQLRLMPSEKPEVLGLDVAGRCVPASQVGGDFYQYYPMPRGRFAVTLADVCGHAMAAAIPAVMFSGILENETRRGGRVEHLFGNLNQTLLGVLEPRTFICCCVGEYDTMSGIMRVINTGCPFPFHFRSRTGDLAELEVAHYPLGVRSETSFDAQTVQMEVGDYLILHSDGLAETSDARGEVLGFDRMAELTREGCVSGLDAPSLVEHMMSSVESFGAGSSQEDDRTVLVVKVTD